LVPRCECACATATGRNRRESAYQLNPLIELELGWSEDMRDRSAVRDEGDQSHRLPQLGHRSGKTVNGDRGNTTMSTPLSYQTPTKSITTERAPAR
jgi:hypothetical protein